jgi:hypothetical protein
MKFIKGLIWWVIAVTFTAIFISLGLSWISAIYDFVPNPRNVWLAILASGTLIWWTLPRVRLWWRWQREFPIKPFLSALTIAIISGVTDACAAEMQEIHKVLIRPEVTPMIKWSLISGPETWVWILLITVGLGLFYIGLMRFVRNCDERRFKRQK